MKRHIAIASLFLASTGCFAIQRDTINREADWRLQNLNAQCMQTMTEWCRVQYQIIESSRERDLADLAERRAMFVQSMQNVGASLQHNGTQCSTLTNNVGGVAISTTNCQ